MNCPKCSSAITTVTDSRPNVAPVAIRRRRRCEGCGERFTTYEVAAADMLALRTRADGRLGQGAMRDAAEVAAIFGSLSPSDAELFVAFARRLTGETDEERQDRFAYEAFQLRGAA